MIWPAAAARRRSSNNSISLFSLILSSGLFYPFLFQIFGNLMLSFDAILLLHTFLVLLFQSLDLLRSQIGLFVFMRLLIECSLPLFFVRILIVFRAIISIESCLSGASGLLGLGGNRLLF